MHIILQILSMQFLYYTTLSLSILLVDALFQGGLRSHLGQIFSPSSLEAPAEASPLDYRLATILAHCLNVPLVVASLAFIVEKANKCVDFTVTIFFYHLLATWAVYRFPTSWAWWITHAVIVTATVLIGEQVCFKLETAEIKLSFGHIVSKGKESAQQIITKGKHRIQKKKEKNESA